MVHHYHNGEVTDMTLIGEEALAWLREVCPPFRKTDDIPEQENMPEQERGDAEGCQPKPL